MDFTNKFDRRLTILNGRTEAPQKLTGGAVYVHDTLETAWFAVEVSN